MEKPDLGYMSTADLVELMLACGMSSDPSDKEFAKACRDEIARRKPTPTREKHDERKTRT
jgi:hypothetical protein